VKTVPKSLPVQAAPDQHFRLCVLGFYRGHISAADERRMTISHGFKVIPRII